VALVNNAQREHQEFLHGLEAVARENGSVIRRWAADGTVVFPADDACTPLWRELAGARRVRSFALDGAPTCTARRSGRATTGRCASRTRRPRRHHAGHRRPPQRQERAGRRRLRAGRRRAARTPWRAAWRPSAGGRAQPVLACPGRAQVTLVDDSYNANPDSVLAAIDVLAELPGPRWLLLGDMGEVGDQGPAFHAEVGRHAAARGIDTCGPSAAQSEAAARECGGAPLHRRHRAAGRAAAGPAAASVLVKGSRFDEDGAGGAGADRRRGRASPCCLACPST
jgi:UDP-N-acetylmuramoyl-tripeptide--D-alanyl-D-alanine ligase